MFRIVSASGGEVPGAVMGLAKQKAAQLVRIGKRPAKNAVAYSAYPDELYIGVIQLGQTPAGDLIIVLLQRTDPDTGNPTTGKITKSHIAAGGFVFGGAATVNMVVNHIASGGFVFGGSAAVNKVANHIAAGGLVFGGAATVNMVANHIASGGFVFGGSAAVNKVANHIAAGGFVFGGAATVAVTFASITVTVTVSGYVTYGSPLSTVVSATESPLISGTWSWSSSLSTSNLPVGTYDISATYTPTDTAYAAEWDGDWVTVIQKAISITADNMSKTYGDADPAFTYSSSGLVSGDGISGALARTSGSYVGTYSISIGTLSAGGNYSTSFTGATLTINKANQMLGTVTTVWTAGAGNPAIGGREVMIGDTAVVSVSSQGASGNAVTYTSSNAGVCTVSGTTLTIVGIGSFTITAHQAGNSNYNAAADKSNSALNIVKTPATVSSANASVTYNGSPQSASCTTTPSGLSLSYTYNGSPTAPTNAGTYTVVASVTNDIRYTGSITFSFIIQKATPVITWPTPLPIVYSTPLSATQLNASANVAGTFVYDHQVGAILTAGSQALGVTFTPTDTANYAVETDGVWLQVNKASLYVYAQNVTILCFEPIPTFTFGLFCTDGQIIGVTGTPILSTTATSNSPEGFYEIDIAIGTLSAPNYNIGFQVSLLCINVAPHPPMSVSCQDIYVGQTIFPKITGAIGDGSLSSGGNAGYGTTVNPVGDLGVKGIAVGQFDVWASQNKGTHYDQAFCVSAKYNVTPAASPSWYQYWIFHAGAVHISGGSGSYTITQVGTFVGMVFQHNNTDIWITSYGSPRYYYANDGFKITDNVTGYSTMILYSTWAPKLTELSPVATQYGGSNNGGGGYVAPKPGGTWRDNVEPFNYWFYISDAYYGTAIMHQFGEVFYGTYVFIDFGEKQTLTITWYDDVGIEFTWSWTIVLASTPSSDGQSGVGIVQTQDGTNYMPFIYRTSYA